jgi:hypothetical protein
MRRDASLPGPCQVDEEARAYDGAEPADGRTNERSDGQRLHVFQLLFNDFIFQGSLALRNFFL